MIGQRLRISTTLGEQLQGVLVGREPPGLQIVEGTSPTTVPLLVVERLWVRGRATRRGAIIGAGVGVLAGIVVGLLASSVACEPVDGGDCTAAEVAAVTGLLGGAGGAVVGMGIGSAIPMWRFRFP